MNRRTPRHKTHSTASASDVTVAYPWHPWHGHPVRSHEVIERATGTWARCSLAGSDAVRLREIPVWMLDASVCCSVRRVPSPIAALSALLALRALLSKATTDAAAKSPGAAIASPAQQSGDRHAPPLPTDTSVPTQSLPDTATADGRGGPRMEQPARSDQTGSDGPDAPAVARTRRQHRAGDGGRRQ